MRVIPKAANDMMDVGRLQGFDVSVILFPPSLFLFLVYVTKIHSP